MRAVPLVAMWMIAACAHPTEPALADDWVLERHATPVPIDVLEQPQVKLDHMPWKHHFDDLSDLERWLVTGRLDEATTLAALFARPPNDSDERLDAAATIVAHAPTIARALQDEPMIDVACASCHERSHARVTFPFRGAPHERLAQHRWAVDRLREGIVGPDATRWKAGLEMLATAPPVMHDARWVDAVRMQTLAALALFEPPSSCDQRAVIYGDLLATCAGCHAKH